MPRIAKHNSVPTRINASIRRLVRDFRPERIILFGSHGRGSAGPDSDIDLLVVLPVRGSKLEAALALRRALGPSPIPLDLIVTTPEEFAWRKDVVGTIEWPAAKEGKVLYDRERDTVPRRAVARATSTAIVVRRRRRQSVRAAKWFDVVSPTRLAQLENKNG